MANHLPIVVKVGIGVSRSEEGQTSIGCRDALKDPIIRSYYRAQYVGTITSRALSLEEFP
jgi:hypothetical protein